MKEHRRAEMVLNNAKADMPSLKKQTNETLVDLNNSKREMEKIKGIFISTLENIACHELKTR